MARNVFLIGCAIVGVLAPTGPVRAGETVLAVAGALVVGLLVVMLDDLRYLFGTANRT